MEFAKEQPKDGETILHCGHLEGKHYFFGFGEKLPEIEFSRPDGSKGKSRWMVLCQMCFNSHGHEPGKCIRADSRWVGNEPAIKENKQ